MKDLPNDESSIAAFGDGSPTLTLPIISELFMTSLKTEGTFLRDG
jgi:hypothetical protein